MGELGSERRPSDFRERGQRREKDMPKTAYILPLVANRIGYNAKHIAAGPCPADSRHLFWRALWLHPPFASA